MNTPDTEVEKLVKLNRTCGCTLGWCTECLKWRGVVELATSSRDTYWKEQLEKAVLKGERRRIIEQIREERDTYWKERVRKECCTSCKEMLSLPNESDTK